MEEPQTLHSLLQGPWTDPLEWAYYDKLPIREWGNSKVMARHATEALAGTRYAEFIRSCGPVEKAGEFILKEFLSYYCGEEKISEDFFLNDPYLPSFVVNGRSVDVHTRMLKFAQNYSDLAGNCLSLERFLVMVPELGLVRSADVYVFAGVDVRTRDSYLFGWTTPEKLAAIALSEDAKHPAKCMHLNEIYTMHSLLDYLQSP